MSANGKFLGSEKFLEIIKKAKDFIVKFFKTAAKFILVIIILIIMVLVAYVIIFLSSSWNIRDKLKGCLEANEFGQKNNVILAYSLNNDDNDFSLLNYNTYKHEYLMQKIKQTDLGLTLNGDPITINITGTWSPWRSNLARPSSDTVLEHSSFYNLDDKFLCAMEIYKNTEISDTIINDEITFYYIKNYFEEIRTFKNDTDKEVTYFGKVVQPGKRILVGVERKPEQQKSCKITRGIGLYLASYGITGRSEPSSYHHLVADKLICNKTDWFGDGKGITDSTVITNYKEPTGAVDYSNCVNLLNKSKKKNCTESDTVKRDEERGLCLELKDGLNVIYDCKKYEDKKYTYADFKKNYFDISYHVNGLNTENNEILVDDGYQIIFNVSKYEQQLINNKVKNYGYIIASSMEKFMSACYSEEKASIDSNEMKRTGKSYFQYGPKQLYKATNKAYNEPYSFGEKIKMVILDKLYDDNDGFYQIDIISGINLDDSKGITKKLKEIEYFLLGTPKKGGSDDRADGIVAQIFNNIASSEFGVVVRILLVFVVIFWGYRVIFGIKAKDDSGQSSDLINKTELLMFIFKTSIIITLISPGGFNLFNKLVINFFINGTIGLIDLVSNIFSNTLMPENGSLAAGLQNISNSVSLSDNFAILDELAAFFTGNTLTVKIMSFFYNWTDYFFFGMIISILLMLLLLYYFWKVISSVIPFIVLLLHFTVLLPLAPFFLLLSLFKTTESYLKEWINTILSKCLELVSFFTAFYFFTSIINNIIKELLNFKVCFVSVGDFLLPEGTKVSPFIDWAIGPMRKLLNNFVITQHTNLADDFFLTYCLNILIAFCLIFLYGMIMNSIMGIVSGIISINGARASGNIASATGKTLDDQFTEAFKSTGLSNVQDFKPLSWTRNLVDLKAGGKHGIIATSVGKTLKKAGKTTLGLANALTGVDREKGETFKDRMKRFGKDTMDEFLGEDFFKKNEKDEADDNIFNVVTGGYFEDELRSTKKSNSNGTKNKTVVSDLEKLKRTNEENLKNENINFFPNKDEQKESKESKKDEEGKEYRENPLTFTDAIINNANNGGKFDKKLNSRMKERFATNNLIFDREKNNTENYDKINSNVSNMSKEIKDLESKKSEIEENKKYIKIKKEDGTVEKLSIDESKKLIELLIKKRKEELEQYTEKIRVLLYGAGYQDIEYIKEFTKQNDSLYEYFEDKKEEDSSTDDDGIQRNEGSGTSEIGTNESLLDGDATSLLTGDAKNLLSDTTVNLLTAGNQILLDSVDSSSSDD